MKSQNSRASRHLLLLAATLLLAVTAGVACHATTGNGNGQCVPGSNGCAAATDGGAQN